MGNRDFLVLKTKKHGEICLRPHQKITFGRDPRADYVIDDRKLSGLHFAIEYRDTPLILDLKSTNGTLVNNKRICCKKLRSGDVIVAGLSTFTVEFRPDPGFGTTNYHGSESTLITVSP